MTRSPALIEFDRTQVMRGDTLALDDVSLQIGLGEHVAIVGPNGCGKSTLIKTITRECYPMYRETSAVRILGQERWDVFELRSLLGIVSSDLMTTCTRRVSGLEVVVAGFFSSAQLWPHQQVTEAMIEKATRAMELLGVSHLVDRNVTEMSSGEARRTLIARALAHEPRALILDEPSVALDPGAQVELRSRVRTLAQSGTGIVMVTHHLSDLFPEIERVLLMQQGKIVADGSPRELLTDARLSDLFGVQLRVYERDGFYGVI